MFEIDRKNFLTDDSSDKSRSNFSDEEALYFFLRLMMAYEVQKHVENSFKDNNIVSKLDKLLFDVEKELFSQREKFDVQ